MTTYPIDNDRDETTVTSTPAFTLGNRRMLKVFRTAFVSSVVAVLLGSQAAIAQSGGAPFVGGNNHVVSNSCEPIKDLKVTIHATQDIVGPLGLGFQLNATAPTPTKYDQEHPHGPTPGWQQYMIGIGPQPGINFAIQLWPLNFKGNSLLFIPSTVFYSGVGIVLPKNYTLTITLANSGDDVVAAIFSVQDGSGKPPTTIPVPLVLLPGAHRIVTAFQMNLVGPTGGDVLSQGAGWIKYSASTPLTASNKDYPGNYPACIATNTLTGENSNMAYDPIVKGADNTLIQSFYVPQRPGSDWGGPLSNAPVCVAPLKYDYQQQRCSTGGTDVNDQAPPQTFGQPVETLPH
jgi:hypothetical protein